MYFHYVKHHQILEVSEMKKRQIWRKVTACILAALMLTLTLTACGEASSLVTEENEETGGLEVTAEQA